MLKTSYLRCLRISLFVISLKERLKVFTIAQESKIVNPPPTTVGLNGYCQSESWISRPKEVHDNLLCHDVTSLTSNLFCMLLSQLSKACQQGRKLRGTARRSSPKFAVGNRAVYIPVQSS